MARKPRSDSVLDSLPPERREQLVRWLVDENLKYPEAVTRVWERFGVKTSVSALQKFYARRCFTLRAEQANEFAELVVEQAKADPARFDAATLALVKQKAFERVYARDGNLSELALLAGILGDAAKLDLKRQELALADRRVALLEKKAAQADAAEAATRDTTLTPEQRSARLKEIFGLK